MRRLLTAVGVLAAAGWLAAATSAGTHFTDPTGDSGAAPDVVGVDVSDDAAGNMTFLTTLVPRATFASDESVDIFVNSDRNGATGSTKTGSEFVLDFTSAGWGLYHWDGGQFSPVTSHGTIDVAVDQDAQTFSIRAVVNKADLGGTSSFDFFVQTTKGTGASTDPYDEAPDGTALYTYTLAARASVKAIGADVPTTAHPGKVVRLANFDLSLSDGTTVKPSRVTCKAAAAGHALKSAGGCAFLVPRAAAGKTVAVTVTVAYQGGTYSTRYTIRVAKR